MQWQVANEMRPEHFPATRNPGLCQPGGGLGRTGRENVLASFLPTHLPVPCQILRVPLHLPVGRKIRRCACNSISYFHLGPCILHVFINRNHCGRGPMGPPSHRAQEKSCECELPKFTHPYPCGWACWRGLSGLTRIDGCLRSRLKYSSQIIHHDGVTN